MNGGIAEGVDLAIGRWTRDGRGRRYVNSTGPNVEQFPRAPRQAGAPRNRILIFQTVFAPRFGPTVCGPLRAFSDLETWHRSRRRALQIPRFSGQKRVTSLAKKGMVSMWQTSSSPFQEEAPMMLVDLSAENLESILAMHRIRRDSWKEWSALVFQGVRPGERLLSQLRGVKRYRDCLAFILRELSKQCSFKFPPKGWQPSARRKAG
jgi:hypothetical protein